MSIYDELADMIEILDDFVVETTELLDQLNQDLLTLESGVDDEVINRTFRAFHTIKGTSGFLNFEVCMDLAHVAEDLLNQIRNGERQPTPEIIDVLLETTDWFRAFLEDVENRVEGNWDATAMQAAIGKLMDAPEAVAAEKPQEKEEPAGEEWVVLNVPQELLDEFVSESKELLDSLSNDILSLEIEPENSELINQIFRVFHTVKGNSGLVGLSDMSEIAHLSEDVLGKIREKQLLPETFVVDTLLSALDYLRNTADEAANGKVKRVETRRLRGDLDRVLSGDYPRGEETGIATEPERESAESTPAAAKEKVAVPKGSEKTANEAPEQAAKGGMPKPTRKEQTIRVDVHRLDNLMNIVGELVLEKNRLLQVSRTLQSMYNGSKEMGDLESLNNSLGYITSEIQESVMQMRMLPIANVFRKFPRLVRDLAKEKQKEVRLVISGEETELDRSVIEAIGDPLVHLLRNAIDHGIEAPDVRSAAGKPREGTVHLSAYQEGNQIAIEIADDGSGIDPEKIRKKAVEKGLVSAEEAASLSPRDAVNLIFKPGFSTAEKVTDVSGRGVGMDVVNSNISKLNGSVEINTEVGEGSTFIIKLPLTLTIMTGMVVKVYDELYIIPLIAISETLRMEKAKISTVRGQRVLTLRDSVLPILYLDQLMETPHEAEAEDSYIVIVSVGEKQLGLVVTELLGQEETVVKPLARSLGKLEYFAGATLRGDGRVCLILDIPQIMGSGLQEGPKA